MPHHGKCRHPETLAPICKAYQQVDRLQGFGGKRKTTFGGGEEEECELRSDGQGRALSHNTLLPLFQMASKCALITGITGQDGSYLAEWLLGKGYRVHGIVRLVALEAPAHRLSRLKEIRGRLVLHAASLESYASMHRVVHDVQPDECYHLAAQSFVSYSFDDEFSTLNANINGTHFLLSALRTLTPDCRFYFAGSSEMFGMAETVPQNEGTRFHPRSSYGISKVAGFDLTRNYREA